MSERKFSKKCGKCRQRSMVVETVPYTVHVAYDGTGYDITLPALTAPKCTNCGAISIDEVADEQVDDAFRQRANLLSREQIRKNREALGLTQKELGKRLGVGEELPSRWEMGTQIQDRAADTLLRLFFGLEAVQNALEDEEILHRLGTSVTAGQKQSVMSVG